MRAKCFAFKVIFIFLGIFVLINLGKAKATEPKDVIVDLVSCNVAYSGPDNICLIPVFKLSNVSNQLISATFDYNLKIDDQLMGSAQMPTIYIPSKAEIIQRDSVVVVYRSWFASFYFVGNSPGQAIKAVLPLWKALGGKEPAKIPEGLWDKIEPTKSKIAADGSVTLKLSDGEEKISFFRVSTE
jgi:hypothetical protein